MFLSANYYIYFCRNNWCDFLSALDILSGLLNNSIGPHDGMTWQLQLDGYCVLSLKILCYLHYTQAIYIVEYGGKYIYCDVMTWKHTAHYWSYVRGFIDPLWGESTVSPVNSPLITCQ